MSKWWSQAVLSFGPSALLHPPTPGGAVPPAYGRGWPGSSGQHRLRPCHPPLPFIAKVARTSPAYGRGWPGSSGQHRLQPGTYPLLPTRSTRKLSISTIPPCACQDCPPANSSLSYPPSLRLRVQLIYLPAWDYLPSYGMGPYTIVRYGTIDDRTVWEHRLSHG